MKVICERCEERINFSECNYKILKVDDSIEPIVLCDECYEKFIKFLEGAKIEKNND